MNTNMAGFRWFLKSLCACALKESSLSLVGVKQNSTILVIFLGIHALFLSYFLRYKDQEEDFKCDYKYE